MVEEYFGPWKPAKTTWQNTFKGEFKPEKIVEPVAQFQDHYMIGWRIPGIFDEKRHALVLLNNVLGGPAMNSRLGLNIREKHGIAYNIESYMNLYTDIGMLGVYLGCDSAQTKRATALVAKEIEKFQNKPLGTLQLSKAKNQFLGQMALGEENGLNSAIGAARSLLHFGKVNTFQHVIGKIRDITSEEIRDVANEFLTPDKSYELLYKKP